MNRFPIARTLAAAALLAVAAHAPAGAAGAVEIAWCTGLSPVSWGFAVQPDRPATEVRLVLASPTVRLLSGGAGPDLPADWTVAVEDGALLARGTTPLDPGVQRDAFLVAETNRGTASVDGRGARGVEWEVEIAAAAEGGGESRDRLRLAPPAMLELPDAVSRGLVIVSMRARGPLGPVEITVDNPTPHPLWLDVAPGQALSCDGADWIVGLVRPYRLEAKQRLGRTIAAFPVVPTAATAPPRHLAWGARRHERAGDLVQDSLAAARLQDEIHALVRARGTVERALPFDFWPLVVAWCFWTRGGEPASPEILARAVASLLDGRSASGDERSAALDAGAAAAEVEAMAVRVRELRLASAPSPAALEALASLERWR